MKKKTRDTNNFSLKSVLTDDNKYAPLSKEKFNDLS